MEAIEGVQIVDGHGPELPLIEAGPGSAEAIVWPGVGAELRSLHRFRLGGGGRTRQQTHPMEAVYYVVRGEGMVEGETGTESFELVTGSMVHVSAGTPYSFSSGEAGIEILGGPCPADHSLYSHLNETGSSS